MTSPVYKYPKPISAQGIKALNKLIAAKTSIGFYAIASHFREDWLELAAIELVEWWILLPEGK